MRWSRPLPTRRDAQPFAERHCAKYDRFELFRRMDGVKAIFDCTPERVEKQLEPTPRGIY